MAVSREVLDFQRGLPSTVRRALRNTVENISLSPSLPFSVVCSRTATEKGSEGERERSSDLRLIKDNLPTSRLTRTGTDAARVSLTIRSRRATMFVRGPKSVYPCLASGVTMIDSRELASPRSATLLVAMPTLVDTNFCRSVILLTAYTKMGAMGYVVNNPSFAPLHRLLTLPDVDVPSSIPSWFGGPVDQTVGVLLGSERSDASDLQVAPGVYLTTSETVLHHFVSHFEQPKSVIYPYRFVVGYAGWGPGQLDRETRSGAWSILPIDLDVLFNIKHQYIWPEAMMRLGVDITRLAPAAHQYLN